VAFLQTGFALHQEPRNKKFREKIIAPPGYTIVEFDAANQETRWMAELSNDGTMKALCEPGQDMHSYMGARIDTRWTYETLAQAVKADDKVAKNIRMAGKVGNLSCQYRTSAGKLLSVARVQYDLDMELPLAARIHSTYRRTYLSVPRYWDKQIAKVQRLGYAETLAGRRVEVKGDWSRGSKTKWALESTAINYPIQGVGAEQKYLALAKLKDEAYSKYDAHFFMDLHDGIYNLVKDDQVEKFIMTCKKILDTLPYQEAWGYTPSVPLPWDASFGPSWGMLKSWKG
jgi:DNA polymerase I